MVEKLDSQQTCPRQSVHWPNRIFIANPKQHPLILQHIGGLWPPLWSVYIIFLCFRSLANLLLVKLHASYLPALETEGSLSWVSFIFTSSIVCPLHSRWNYMQTIYTFPGCCSEIPFISVTQSLKYPVRKLWGLNQFEHAVSEFHHTAHISLHSSGLVRDNLQDVMLYTVWKALNKWQQLSLTVHPPASSHYSPSPSFKVLSKAWWERAYWRLT